MPEFNNKAMYKLSYGLFVCTAVQGDKKNGCIINTAVQVASDPNTISIAVNKANYTHDMIKATMACNISVISKEATFDLFKHFGFQSGRDVDKFEAQGLTREKADTVSAPLIAESPVNIECRVKDIVRMPSHDMFMAEITAVHVDEKYVDEKGAYDFGAMDLVAFNHGKYYRLKAEELGFFGFSVMKPKTAKRKAAEKAQRKRK